MDVDLLAHAEELLSGLQHLVAIRPVDGVPVLDERLAYGVLVSEVHATDDDLRSGLRRGWPGYWPQTVGRVTHLGIAYTELSGSIGQHMENCK